LKDLEKKGEDTDKRVNKVKRSPNFGVIPVRSGEKKGREQIKG